MALMLLSAPQPLAAETLLLEGADHHMHLRSEQSAEAWAALCQAMPAACGELPSEPLPTQAESLIPLLDEAGLQGGVVLSIAYFFGFPELGGRFDDPALVRAENQFVAQEVAQFPTRLVGFFSVNPRADYAMDEVRYWAGRPGLTGLKLHLANSNVDLSDDEQLARLAALFAQLDAHGAPAVVHLRNRNPAYGYDDASAFIARVLVPAPHVKVQIAHMGGWGGYDAATDGAVKAFLDAFAYGRLDRQRVYFDLAAVVLPGTTEEQLLLLGQRIREIGPEQVLFGTDWDALASPADTREAMESLDILDEQTWQIIFSNQAPWLPASAPH
jgi:predicted TIM-barrel fold metal-dependent hydrolase